MSVKNIIKNIITIIMHPIVSIKLRINGARNIYIGPRCKINNISKLSVKQNVYIGSDARFLMVDKYHGGIYNPQITIGNGVSIGSISYLY